jgi:tetratricopeptide (TPR) repeat protein
VVKATLGQFDTAMQVAGTLEHPDNIYAAAAIRHAAVREDDLAAEMVEKIAFPTLQANTYAHIAVDKFEAADNAAAEKWLEKAAASVEEILTDEEKLTELSGIADLYIRIGRKDLAIALISKARDAAERSETRSWRDQAFSSLAELYFRADSTDLAENTLDQIADTYWFARALTQFASIKAERGDEAGAIDDLEEACALLLSQKSGEIYDSAARSALLQRIAQEFAPLGKFERAMDVAGAITMPEYGDAARIRIAVASVNRGEDDHAEQAVRAINDDAFRPFAKLNMISAYRAKDENEKARTLLDEVHSEVDAIPQLRPQSELLNALAERAHDLGDDEKAMTLIEDSLRKIEQIKDQVYKVYFLAEVADKLTEMGLEPGHREKQVLNKMVIAASL